MMFENREVVKEALKDVEAVFHLAATTNVSYSVKHADVTGQVNVEGTRKIFEARLHARAIWVICLLCRACS